MDLLQVKLLGPIINHQNLKCLFDLPVVTLLTTGRTGTDFLQSLLDSHPEVLTFNGIFHFHKFWDNSICVRSGNFHQDDFLSEFIGEFIHKLKSKYDLEERKNELGKDYNLSININLDLFRNHVNDLMQGKSLTSKNYMIAIYGAYAQSIGQNLTSKKILFHHLHNIQLLDRFLKDFPKTKIISNTRDPRANFVSGIEHWREYDPITDQEGHLFFYINRILADSTVLHKYDNDYMVIRLEDLGQEKILRKLCRWLKISYHPCLKESTWGCMQWHGDRLSKKNESTKGFSNKFLNNKWEQKLSWKDKYIFNYLMNVRLKSYRYSYKNIYPWDHFIIPLFILFPLSYEWKYFSPLYIINLLKYRELSVKRAVLRTLKNGLYYLLRVQLFYRYYIKIIIGKPCEEPLL